MSEWKKVKLGDIANIRTGKLDSNAAVPNGLYPFFTCDPNTLRINNWAYDTEAVLLAGNNASGNYTAKYYHGKFNAYQRTYIIESSNTDITSTRFLAFAMNLQLRQLKVMSSGSTTKFITMKMLTGLDIPQPNIKTQLHIATILSRYDSLIENYQKQIKLLEEAAQRLYKEWFVDLRFPGYENTKIIDGLPEGWEKKRLGDITCKFATGLNPRKNFVLGHGKNYYVTIKNMSNNDVIFDDKCDKVDDEALEKINKRSDLQMGDLLFSGIGTIGRVYLIDKPVNNWNISESVFTMRPNKDIPVAFLYLTLLDKEIQDYCQSNAHGCAQKGIRMADLKAYEIKVPSGPIFSLFSKIVTPLVKQVKEINSQIRLLTEARDRLLPKLMSGEIAV